MGYDRRIFLTLGAPRSRESIRGENRGILQGRDASQNAPLEFARRSSTTLARYSGSWGYAQAAHLLRRSMFGPSEAETLQAVVDGLDATIEKLFTPWTPSKQDIATWSDEPQFQAAPDTAAGEDLQTFVTAQNGRRDGFGRYMVRAVVESPVSIQERLRLFWHGHFTTEIEVVRFPELCYQQYELFRRLMLGNFKQFVYDVTIDMAMLLYLDGIKNYKITIGAQTRDNINENYARELMELFTMGVYDWEGNANYTQDDVMAAARSLSGWSYNVDNIRNQVWVDRASVFKTLLWDNGQKRLMGQTGNWDTQGVIDVLFEQRADQIAKFICEKIYRAFVYDVPDRTIITEMAATFRANNWELRPVFDQLLKSEHFYDVTNIGALHKGPIDVIIGSVRSLELTNVPGLSVAAGGRRNADRDLGMRLQTLGQVPYSPPNVKGWPGGRTWTSTSTLPQRQKFAIDVADGKIDLGTSGRQIYYAFDPIAFAKTFSDPNDLHVLADEMARFLLNTPPSSVEAEMLFETILDGGRDYEWDIDDPDQRPGERIRKFVQAAVQLAKYQLY